MKWVLGLLLALVVAAPAEAQKNRTAKAKAIAEKYWETGCFDYGFHRLSMDRAGYAYYYFDQATRKRCHVYLDPDETKGMRWPLYCGLIVHEYGHLADQDHSADPDSIMYPWISKRNVPLLCRR